MVEFCPPICFWSDSTVRTPATMEQERKYSPTDITKLIGLLRDNEVFTPAELAGLDKFADMLKWLGTTSDAEIEAGARRYCRSIRD